MRLYRKHMRANGKGLAVRVRAGQQRGRPEGTHALIRVPVEQEKLRRKLGYGWVLPAGGPDPHGPPADLGPLGVPVYGGTANLCDQLRTETDTQGRQTRVHGFSKAPPLGVQPWIVPLVVHTHRSTEADNATIAVQRGGQRFLKVRTTHLHRDTLGNEHLSQGTEVLVWVVLYDQ